ncbi:hypothetical protein K505DRAFT_375166 [Melanomma pulvis-pyrius CBS 109.77]|uniref:Uncharacterized protein n=1 Tax=Melanomma pulvis-pyrius CBS 109.77 TaxID=1314802 RepID=A0A6A6XB43_9PLEO|nr:hypothetical protein K505DRAFT_375166 [Melanomma pulvis-pyrius CBS 109.77]
MNDSSSTAQDQPPPPAIPSYSLYQNYPPDDPPPSYDDATHSSITPLLVGPPPDYGTGYRAGPDYYTGFRPGPVPGASSTASSDTEVTSRSLPEWVGQALVVFCFVFILSALFTLLNDSDGLPDGLPNGLPG